MLGMSRAARVLEGLNTLSWQSYLSQFGLRLILTGVQFDRHVLIYA